MTKPKYHPVVSMVRRLVQERLAISGNIPKLYYKDVIDQEKILVIQEIIMVLMREYGISQVTTTFLNARDYLNASLLEEKWSCNKTLQRYEKRVAELEFRLNHPEVPAQVVQAVVSSGYLQPKEEVL